MASQILIQQAAKMYESGVDTTDYAKLLLDPAAAAMKENIKEQKKITDDLIRKMPAGVDISKVDEKLRPMITNWLASKKQEYIEAAKVLGSGMNSTDPKYIAAVEKMNGIQTAFENLDGNLTGLAEKIKFSLENKDNKAGGIEDWANLDSEKFANKSIYDSILEHGIGNNGELSYTSGELTDPNRQKIDDLKKELETLDKNTQTDKIDKINNEIKNLELDKGISSVKLVSDYGGPEIHNTDYVDAVGALRKEIKTFALDGGAWDEEEVKVAVNSLINKMGATGVRDLMFKHYIDDYIETNNEGVKKGTDAFERIKDGLRTQDLTDEFRNHLLGTKEKPGMLRDTYTDNFKKDNSNPEAGTGVERAQQQLALGVKRLDPRIVTKMGGEQVEWTKEMVKIGNMKVPIYYTETEDGVGFKTPYELQSYAGAYATQKGFEDDLMVLSAEDRETVEKHFKDKGIGVSPFSTDTIKEVVGTNVRGDMVEPLNTAYSSEGFSFESESKTKNKRIKVKFYNDNEKWIPFNSKFHDNLAKYMEIQLKLEFGELPG